MKHYRFTISDYEHSGDLDWARQALLEDFPKVTNIHAYEERDYEAECEYESDYGEEPDEPIYQGYIEFDAPDEYEDMLKVFYL